MKERGQALGIRKMRYRGGKRFAKLSLSFRLRRRRQSSLAGGIARDSAVNLIETSECCGKKRWLEKGEDLEPVGSIRSADSHRLHSLKEIVSLAAAEAEGRRKRERGSACFLCVPFVRG